MKPLRNYRAASFAPTVRPASTSLLIVADHGRINPRRDHVRLTYALESKFPAIRDPWHPAPPSWVKWLPAGKMLYHQAIHERQTCAEHHYNWRQHSLINVKTPKGWSRARFEQRFHKLLEAELAWSASRGSLWVAFAILLLLVGVAVIISMAVYAAPSAEKAAVAVLLAILMLVLPETLCYSVAWAAKVEVRPTWLRVLMLIQLLASSWAVVSLKDAPIADMWKLSVASALLGKAAITASGVIGGRLWIMQTKRWRRRNLDAFLASRFASVYHNTQVHRQDIVGDRAIQMADGIDGVARIIREDLPHHLSGSGNSRRDQNRQLAHGIAAHAQGMRDMLLKSGGVKRVRRYAEQGCGLIVAGAWLELPRAENPTMSDGAFQRILRAIRSMLAAVAPLAIVTVLQRTELLGQEQTEYASTAAVVWLIITIGSWLDPEFGERLDQLVKARSLFRPVAVRDKQPSENGNEDA